MNNVLIEVVPNIVKAIWDYYGEPRREHLIHIPKEIDAEVEPGMTCRMLTEAIDRYIINYPEKAIEHRIVVWFGELLCYKKSGEMNDQRDIYVSCHGRAYYYDDGKLTEMPHEIVKHGSNSYWRYPLPWAKEPLQDMSEYDVDLYSLAPHRTVCYFPDNPMPKLWSKLFDTLRNGIPEGMIKSGGDYYVIEYNRKDKEHMEVITTKGGKVLPRRDSTGKTINHVADHVFNDTAQEPGVHMWFDCRLVLPDINRLNNHRDYNNDRDCLSWPMPQAGFARIQHIQYEPYQYVEYTQYTTHDPYRFDRVGDRAIRYYHQMIQQYFKCIDAGCPEINFDEYDWCEAMK
ncbi:TPA: hypothetical protein JS359_004512 [Escherichia coli]|nr:hypothetical protein [Escherichia coli]